MLESFEQLMMTSSGMTRRLSMPCVEVRLREFALMRSESRNLAAYLLGVLAAPPEKAGRLNAKVADLLGVAVDRAEAVLLLDLLVALLKNSSLDKTEFLFPRWSFSTFGLSV